MQARGIWSAGQGDDKERFLADLRALRDKAALGYDELAARAHFPTDVLREAEDGPSLPSLPILAAYVRACDGDVPEWEERWRFLGFEAGAELGLPVRPAGASPAAVAGARAGVSVAPPDAYDPERIRAALRGRRERAEQAIYQETATAGLASWDAVAAQSGTSDSSNGNHNPGARNAGLFDARVTRTPDQAESPPGIRHDPFSASWLQDSELTSPLPQDARLASQGGPAPTDFWAPPAAAAAPADLQRPGPARSPAEEHSVPPPSWPPPAETSAGSAPGPAQRMGPELPRRSVPDPREGAPAPAAELPQTPATSAAPQVMQAPPSEARSDRLFPLRLLVVIVVAALIGSILVMVLR